MLFPRSWKWRTSLDWEMPSSHDTLRKAQLRSSGCFCRGRESDDSHWTERCRARLILSERHFSAVLDVFAEVLKLTNLTGLRDAGLACYSPRGTILQFRMHLPRPWKWRTSLDWEMPSSPDTLRELFAGFASMTWNTASESTLLNLPDLV